MVHYFGPAAGQERACKTERFGHTQAGRWIPGSSPAKLDQKPRTILPRRVAAMADRERANQFLSIAAHPEEARSFGRAKPFMAISGIISRTEILQGQGNHSRGMRSID